MIPESAKSEIIRRREEGATWTAIVKWLENFYGTSIHRTTIQRWYDKDAMERGTALLDSLDDDTSRIKLDKKVQTYRQEALFYKKLYHKSLSQQTKQEVLIDAIHEYAPAFEKIAPVQYSPPSGEIRGSSLQTVVAPLSDTHIGEYVDKEQM